MAATQRLLGAILGATHTSQAIGYRVVKDDDTVYSAWTDTGVIETEVAGNYQALVTLPDDDNVRVVWGLEGTDLAEEWISGADLVGADLSSVAAEVWGYAGGRTVTMTLSQLADIVRGTRHTITSHERVAIPLTGLGDITGKEVRYVVKNSPDDDDDDAMVIVSSAAAGLSRAGRAAATAAWGTIERDDDAAGDITIVIEEEGASQLFAMDDGVWALKVWETDGPVTRAEGVATIRQGVLHATS